MNILFVHEVDWQKRVVYEIHMISELLSLLGHNVYAISYEAMWKKDNFWDFGSFKTKVTNVSRAYPEANVEFREPGFIKIPIISRLSFFFTCCSEIEKIDWFDYSKRHLTSPVDHLIFDDLKSKDLLT